MSRVVLSFVSLLAAVFLLACTGGEPQPSPTSTPTQSLSSGEYTIKRNLDGTNRVIDSEGNVVSTGHTFAEAYIIYEHLVAESTPASRYRTKKQIGGPLDGTYNVLDPQGHVVATGLTIGDATTRRVELQRALEKAQGTPTATATAITFILPAPTPTPTMAEKENFPIRLLLSEKKPPRSYPFLEVWMAYALNEEESWYLLGEFSVFIEGAEYCNAIWHIAGDEDISYYEVRWCNPPILNGELHTSFNDVRIETEEHVDFSCVRDIESSDEETSIFDCDPEGPF